MPSAKRTTWGKKYPNLPKLDLIKIQKESWERISQDRPCRNHPSISPISDYTGNNWQLEFGELTFDPITITPETAKNKGLNYTVPVKIKAKLTNKRTGDVKEENVFFLNLPTMTQEGTFIVNGIERGIINQLVRSPGVYFTGEIDPSYWQNFI